MECLLFRKMEMCVFAKCLEMPNQCRVLLNRVPLYHSSCSFQQARIPWQLSSARTSSKCGQQPLPQEPTTRWPTPEQVCCYNSLVLYDTRHLTESYVGIVILSLYVVVSPLVTVYDVLNCSDPPLLVALAT